MTLQWIILTGSLTMLIQMAFAQDCPYDVVFLVDRAFYISDTSPANDPNLNWNLIKTLLNNILSRLTYGSSNVQLATVTFGDNSTIVFDFTTYSTKSGASEALTNLDYMGGGRSNVASAFRVTRTSVLTSRNGKRDGVPSICLLVVTYPPSTETNKTIPERELLKESCRLIVLATAAAYRLPTLNTTYSSYANPGDFYSTPFSSLNSTDIAEIVYNSVPDVCPFTFAQPTEQANTTTDPKSLPKATGSGRSDSDSTTLMISLVFVSLRFLFF